VVSRIALFPALIAPGNWPAFAQGLRRVISGTVRDASGAVLQGAAVTVRHTETGLTHASGDRCQWQLQCSLSAGRSL
jgi:hypothetical protein